MRDSSDPMRIPASVREQFDLTGRTVVITGGAGFLGRQFATAVAEFGATPVLLDINEARLDEAVKSLRNEGHPGAGYAVNLADPHSVKTSVDAVVSEWGGVDVLINSAALAMNTMQAAGADFFAAFEDYDPALWRASIEANLTAVFLISQVVGRHMRGRGHGNIINIATDVAVISPDHRIYQANERYGYAGVSFNTPAAYSASKAGVLALTRYLATLWAKDGVRVNAISPAGVYRNQDPKFVEQLAERIPLGRMAQPHELKGPIVFLASDASAFVTGANLMVDGGRSIW